MSRNLVRLIGIVVVLAAVTAGVALAQTTGKIRGRVSDKETGEVLVGANVAVEGTTLGAVTGVNGEFIILNVPPAAYAVKATYVGYKPVTIRNIRVTIGLTSEVNFSLESEAIPGPAIEIIAQAPLINKNATNAVTVVNQERIEKLPVRTVNEVFALSAGVVQQGGSYYVRGGRAEETAYYMDGVLVNNPINGALTLNIINNAIEEVQTQVGGMTAQYGNAMSGVVSTTSRVGGSKYNVSLEMITDELLGGKESRNFLDTYSYGLNEYVLTLGGPIIPGEEKFRFFLAGQRVFNRSNPSVLDGISYPYIDSNDIVAADFIVTDENKEGGVVSAPPGSTGNRTYLANLINASKFGGGRNLGGAARDSWGLQGNFYADLGKFNVKVGGTYNFTRSIGAYTRGLGIISVTAGTPRGNLDETYDASAYGKFTHILSPTTFYSVQFNYWQYSRKNGDQLWFNDIESYGNPKLPGNEILVGPGRNPANFSVWQFGAAWPGVIPNQYTKQSRWNWGGRADITHQFGRSWEFIAGGEYTRYTVRTYTINARDIYRNRSISPNDPDWLIYNKALVSFQGYDIYGQPFDGGDFTDRTGTTVPLNLDGPGHPVLAGAYIQNKFEFEDLVINFGVRYDHIDPGVKRYKDMNRIYLDSYSGAPIVADSTYQDAEIATQFSPRIGFSFPVTDRTVFHATYGRFIQQGRLSDLYDPRTTAAYFFNATFFRQFPSPNLKPERTTDYEVGFRQQLGDAASFDLSFYYKDVQDLHVLRQFYPAAGSEAPAYPAVTNGDYGTSKGLTLTFQLRRTSRLALNGNYTLSASTATGSTSGSTANIAWQDNSYNGTPYFPVIPSYTNFDRTHTGNVNLDYRFEKDDGGPILERLGANLLFTFSSGIRYTYSQVNGFLLATNAPQAYENWNTSVGPWIYQLDLRVDKSFTLFNQLDLNVYVWVTNLLDRKNVNGLYPATGETENDGWLATSAGQEWSGRYGPRAVEMYNYLQDQIGFYGTPRVIRLGARLSL